jgi:hypothetical protein
MVLVEVKRDIPVKDQFLAIAARNTVCSQLFEHITMLIMRRMVRIESRLLWTGMPSSLWHLSRQLIRELFHCDK